MDTTPELEHATELVDELAAADPAAAPEVADLLAAELERMLDDPEDDS